MNLRRLVDIARTSRSKARAGGLPAWRQFVEMAVLFACRRMGPGYYLQARMWRPEIALRDKWRHAHQAEYLRYVDALNPPSYRKASQHKVTEKAVLVLFALPTAPFFGFVHAVRGRDAQGRDLVTAAELAALLDAHGGERVCFKRVEGYGGAGFVALDVERGDGGVRLRHPLDGSTWSVTAWHKRLLEAPDGWLIEGYLRQHPALSAINPDAVNTLRLWVIERDGRFETVGAFLRVGRRGSQVDNTSRGGLACPIDLATGRIREALDLALERNRYERHPDTDAPLVGVTIPYWQACQQLAARALAAFPQIRFAGIDVAVTVDGPVVVELNVEPDRRGAAHLDLPHRDLFAQR